MVKRSFVIFMVVISCWAVEIYGADDVETAWKNYQAEFPIQAQNNQELAMRKAIFGQTHANIRKHNSNKGALFRMGHNKFSVMTEDEKRGYLGALHPAGQPVRQTSFASSRQIATDLDYRTSICMPPVKNQGGCGSCWAFAATAVVEFQKCMKNGNIPVDLSEQQMVDCSRFNGCAGGWDSEAFRHVASSGGHAYESEYPYIAKNLTCAFNPANYSVGAQISTANPVEYMPSKDTNAIMAVLTGGRILSFYIQVTSSFFSYKSGIYDDANCVPSYAHVMNFVGYGSQDGVNYWVVRNSWGPGWGASGYLLIKRGVNLCLTESYVRTTNVL